jgi:hypothetical protein
MLDAQFEQLRAPQGRSQVDNSVSVLHGGKHLSEFDFMIS